MSHSSNIRVVYVTVRNLVEGKAIARELITERLAGCINILPGSTSIYHWEGKVAEEEETIMICKTTAHQLSQLMTRVKELHSYECPCILSWHVDQADPGYIRWLESNVRVESRF